MLQTAKQIFIMQASQLVSKILPAGPFYKWIWCNGNQKMRLKCANFTALNLVSPYIKWANLSSFSAIKSHNCTFLTMETGYFHPASDSTQQSRILDPLPSFSEFTFCFRFFLFMWNKQSVKRVSIFSLIPNDLQFLGWLCLYRYLVIKLYQKPTCCDNLYNVQFRLHD